MRIYWRVGGGPKHLLGSFARGTAGVKVYATGLAGNGVYEFFSQAVDAAGNVEAPGAFWVRVTVSNPSAAREWRGLPVTAARMHGNAGCMEKRSFLHKEDRFSPCATARLEYVIKKMKPRPALVPVIVPSKRVLTMIPNANSLARNAIAVILGGGRGHPPVAPDQIPRQAGRAAGRQIPPD